MARLSLRRKKPKSTPTRQVTGTSYSAKGSVDIGKADMQEIGSSAGLTLRDPVPALGTDVQAAQTYTKMARSDASVRTSLRAGKAPVLGGYYFVEPASDDPLDLAIAEFVDFNILHGMTTTFLKILEQTLKFFETPKGNSVFELVWEDREWAPTVNAGGANRRVYTMLRKLAYRPPTTISGFTYDDNGGPTGITQNAIRADGTVDRDVPIPIEKLVIFTFDPEGGGIEGTSVLRSAYRNWFYKDKLYSIDAVQKERHGIGVPDVTVQPNASAEEKKLAGEMAKNLRTNEFAFSVHPPNIEVKFLELSGQPVNALESAMHHDTQIMKNVLVQFINAGLDSSGGGRATSATALDTFLKSMKYVASTICGCWNSYVIPPLVAYNFKTDKFPELKVRGIGEAKDLQMFAAAIANLVDKGVLTVDEETENWARDIVMLQVLKVPVLPHLRKIMQHLQMVAILLLTVMLHHRQVRNLLEELVRAIRPELFNALES
jgi:hypothetical protein